MFMFVFAQILISVSHGAISADSAKNFQRFFFFSPFTLEMRIEEVGPSRVISISWPSLCLQVVNFRSRAHLRSATGGRGHATATWVRFNRDYICPPKQKSAVEFTAQHLIFMKSEQSSSDLSVLPASAASVIAVRSRSCILFLAYICTQ